MAVIAKVLHWREKRGAQGWSETLYSGIAIEVNGIPVIVSKLSHGLRVLPRKDDSEYKFEGEGEPVTTWVSNAFAAAAEAALYADKRFQEHILEYNSALLGV